MKMTTIQPIGATATNHLPLSTSKGRLQEHHIKPRHVWKGRIWLLLKPYQRIHILERIAGKAVIR